MFFFLIPFYGFTQQWSCARPGGEYVFSNETGAIYTSFAIDSFYTSGQDTMLVTRNKFWGNDPTYLCYHVNHHPENYSWIGRQIIMKPDGTNLFVRRNDTLILRTRAITGESWACTQNDSQKIEALITKTEVITWENTQTDSVKLIRFRIRNLQDQIVRDTDLCVSALLSQNHGLLTAPGWNYHFSFPYHKIEVDTYRQRGSNSPPWGLRNKTGMEMLDYQVNDEFHHEQYWGSENPSKSSTRIKSIFRVLSKNVLSDDSVVYSMYYSFTRINRYPDSTVVTNGTDTIPVVVTQKQLPAFSKTGCGDFASNGLYINATGWGLTATNRIRKSPDEYLSYLRKDTCFSEVHLDGECIRETYILEGIYGIFTDCIGITYSDYKRLIYYKKGNEVWGAPLSFNEPILPTIEWNVYPNPASENELAVSCNSSARMLLEMFDAMGKQVYSDFLRSTKSINISYLPAGIYLIRLTDEYGNSGVKKLIRN